jgi:hypothetical protein
MPDFAKIAVFVLLLGSPVLVACGEDRSHLLPPDDARAMTTRIDEIQQRVADGDCFGALEETDLLQDQIEALPRSVDRELRRALLDGVVTLTEVQTQCELQETGGTTDAEEEVVEPETEEAVTGPTGTEVGPTGPTGNGNGNGNGNGSGEGGDEDGDGESDGPSRPERPDPQPNPQPEVPDRPETPSPPGPPADPGPDSGGITPNP